MDVEDQSAPLLELSGAPPSGNVATRSSHVVGLLWRAHRSLPVVNVPVGLDADVSALLGLSTALGREVAASVREALESDPSSAKAALHELDRHLGAQKLLVEGLDHLGRGTDEIFEVIAPRRDEVAAWLRDHAGLRVAVRGREVGVRPVETPRWDADVLFKQVERDPERYVLASAFHQWSGEPASRFDAGSLVVDLWEVLPRTIREVMSLLVVHGRPMSRALASHGALLNADVVAAAIDGWLVDDVAGSLRLGAAWYQHAPVQAVERGPLHRVLADGLAKAANDDVEPGVALLEAHRHYVKVPDIAKAREHARFGALYLLDHARQLSIEAKHQESATEYQAVAELDEKSDHHALGARGRAYRTHYEHFNAARAQTEPMEKTLAGYREAVDLWPENALFWSRLVRCHFLLGEWSKALDALSEAYTDARVPPHPRRDATLILRTTERLIERDQVVPAVLVATARPLNQPMTLAQFWRQLELGVEVDRIWSPGGFDVRRHDRALLQLKERDATWTASLGGVEAPGTDPRDALCALTWLLASEGLEQPFAQIDRETAERARPLSATTASLGEPARWAAALAHLYELTSTRKMPVAQHDAVIALWTSARAKWPRLRRPALGPGEAGDYVVSWAYQDVEPAVDLEVSPEGRCCWWMRGPDLDDEGEGSVDEALAAVGAALEAFAEDP